MVGERIGDVRNLASERHILLDCLAKGESLKTDVDQVADRGVFVNNISETKLACFAVPIRARP
jgi:DNA-binding IclR family transcriptional regulator